METVREEQNLKELRALNWDKPAVSLIPELRIRIFFLVLQSCGAQSPSHFNKFNMEYMERKRFLLMVICSQWRQVAISTPLLWTALSISPRHHGFANDAFMRELDRAAQSLLSLLVAVPLHALSREDEIMNAFGIALPRCKHIIIAGEPMFMAQMLTSISDIPNPNLQSLSMSCRSVLNHKSTSGEPIVADLSSLVDLRDLRLDFAYLGDPVFLKISPDTMLRVLEVSGTVIPQDILDTVAYSHLLEEWTWDAFDLKLLQPMTFSLPGLPSLRRLSLHGEFNFSLLDTFRATQLVALELTYRPRRALISRDGFPILLSLPLNSISFPSLQILSIDGYPGIIEKNELSIARFLCNHPTLQFLSLSEGINEGLLDAISALPSLIHFNISNHSHSEPQWHFWSLIRRWHTKARENRQWTSPTLYFPALCWYSGTVKIPAEFEGDLEFCQFARQVVLPLSEPVFEQEMGESIGNWESLLEICGGIPLRDS